jgi:hypothetical protein
MREIGHDLAGFRADGTRGEPLAFLGTGTVIAGIFLSGMRGVPLVIERERGSVSQSPAAQKRIDAAIS